MRSVVVLAAVAAVVSSGCGGAADAGGPATVTELIRASPVTETVSVPATSTAVVTRTTIARVTEAVTATVPPPAPEAAFRDGQWLIGAEVAPGRYRTAREVTSGNCYAVVYDEAGGIVENQLVESGPAIFTVPDRPGLVLESSDCGSWVPVG